MDFVRIAWSSFIQIITVVSNRGKSLTCPCYLLAVAIRLGRDRLEVGPGGFEFVVGHLADSRPGHEEMKLGAVGMGAAILK
jgi:hypothetical protein